MKNYGFQLNQIWGPVWVWKKYIQHFKISGVMQFSKKRKKFNGNFVTKLFGCGQRKALFRSQPPSPPLLHVCSSPPPHASAGGTTPLRQQPPLRHQPPTFPSAELDRVSCRNTLASSGDYAYAYAAKDADPEYLIFLYHLRVEGSCYVLEADWRLQAGAIVMGHQGREGKAAEETMQEKKNEILSKFFFLREWCLSIVLFST